VLKVIRNPDIYHGKNNKSNFFEGWYFKLVEPKRGDTYCFIPGIFISDKKEQSHSFIQVLQDNMQSTDFKPEWLELEITEGQVMKKPEVIRAYLGGDYQNADV